MNTSESQLQSLLSPLVSLEAWGLGRPDTMTLSTYLAHLASFSLLRREEVSLLLPLYNKLRFARKEATREEMEYCQQVLLRLLEAAKQAESEQRNSWHQTLYMRPTPTESSQPAADATEHKQVLETQSTEPSTKTTPEAPVTMVSISAKSTNVSTTPWSRPAATPSGGDATTAKSASVLQEKTTFPSLVRQRTFTTQEAQSHPPIGRFRRWLSRPLSSHVWWIVLLFIVGGALLFWNGVVNSQNVMFRRYQIQNWISIFFGFPPERIPERYLPEALHPRMQRERAIQRFTRYLVQRQPKNPRLWRRLAYYYQEQEQYAQAIVFHSRALSLTPHHPDILNDLAWLLCTADQLEYRDPIRALRLAERAYSLKPTAEVIDTLAEAAFLNGQIQRAVTLAQRAAALKPQEHHYRQQLQRFQQALLTTPANSPTSIPVTP